jgi:hypothetical protein
MFLIFWSLHHQNNRLEKYLFLHFALSSTQQRKKQFLGRKIIGRAFALTPCNPKVTPMSITCHEGTEGKERYSSALL